MPNLDGGHYFLTTLIPLRDEPAGRQDGTVTSTAHLMRETLATLPTAQQSMACCTAGFASPFSRCTRTHFARMAVIDQPFHNGRDPGRTLEEGLRNVNLLLHQPVDHLSSSYLLFTADFDARADEVDDGLASWAEGLWTRMRPELSAIFGPCRGFDRIADGPAFASWLSRCQIETTMSFNDYDVSNAAATGYTRGGLIARLVAGTAGLTLLALFALSKLHTSLWWLLLALPVAAALSLLAVLLMLWNRGRRAFPATPGSDLPSVLKALHVQQRFALLAAELQGADTAMIHASVGRFLAEVRPDHVDEPTQSPGAIRSDGIPLVAHEAVSATRAIA